MSMPAKGFTDLPTVDVATSSELAALSARVAALEQGAPTEPAKLSLAGTITKSEGQSGVTAFEFTVTRSGDLSATSSAQWKVTGSGSNAANAADFQGNALPSGTVSFGAGQASKPIVVNVVGDTVVESNEGFTVTLSAPVNCSIAAGSATATITNDDTATPEPPQSGTEPSAADTGAKGTLTAWTGSTTFSTNDQVIENRSINGSIRVTGKRVKFKNVKITSNAFWGADCEGSDGTVFEYCTISGSPSDGNSCILTGNNCTVRRCDLSKFDNGIMSQSGNQQYIENYIHDLGTTSDAHVDGIQQADPCASVLIQGNSIRSWDTSNVFIKNDTGGDTLNVTIDGNWLRNQGSKKPAATVYIYQNKAGRIGPCKIINNVMEKGGWFYLTTDTDAAYNSVTWTNNTDLAGNQITKPSTASTRQAAGVDAASEESEPGLAKTAVNLAVGLAGAAVAGALGGDKDEDRSSKRR
jgi:hypothetical protein